MPDTPISSIPDTDDPVGEDLLVYVDVSASATRRGTISEIVNSGKPIDYVTTPTSSDYYSAGVGVADGSADFVVAIWQRDLGIAELSTGSRYSIAHGGKWEIFWNFGSLSFAFTDATGVNEINQGASAFYSQLSYVTERDALLMLRVTGGAGTATIRGYVNGVQSVSSLAANPGVGSSTDGIQLGGINGFGAAFRGGIQGAAYLDGTITDDEILAHAEACRVANGLVAGGITWDNLWDHSAVPGASWVATVGSDNLTRTGTTGAASRQLRLA